MLTPAQESGQRNHAPDRPLVTELLRRYIQAISLSMLVASEARFGALHGHAGINKTTKWAYAYLVYETPCPDDVQTTHST